MNVLLNCVLFQGTKPEEISRMINCISPRKVEYGKGEMIAQAGGPMGEIGVVLAGAVAVTKETPTGERIVLNKIHPGGIFGEVAALTKVQRAPATIFSAEDSMVLYFQPERILSPCHNVCPWHRQLTASLVRLIADKALYLNRKIDYLCIKSMRGKLCTFLYEQYQKAASLRFTIPFNRNELAEFLNVSRPSMSRELGRLRDEGILACSGNAFQILDLSKMEIYVE